MIAQVDCRQPETETDFFVWLWSFILPPPPLALPGWEGWGPPVTDGVLEGVKEGI